MTALATGPLGIRAYFAWRTGQDVDRLIGEMRSRPTNDSIDALMKARTAKASDAAVDSVAERLPAIGIERAWVAEP